MYISDPTTDQTQSPLQVALLGDSVLDDFYWLHDKERDVRRQIEDLLVKKHAKNQCFNYAVDQATIGDVLYGMVPPSTYAKSRKYHNFDPYPVSSDGRVHALELIQKHPVPSHVVLSIGGNDARAAFAQSFDLENIYNIMVDNGITKEFEKLIVEIQKHVPNLILVYVYHPEITTFPFFWGLPPASVISRLLTKFSPLFYDMARKYSLPIIDLSRTFNPHSSKDYGTTPIEPSNKSGEYIAELVLHVIENFNFGSNEAKVYHKSVITGEILVEDIDKDWSEDVYGKKLKHHLRDCEKATQSSCAIC